MYEAGVLPKWSFIRNLALQCGPHGTPGAMLHFVLGFSELRSLAIVAGDTLNHQSDCSMKYVLVEVKYDFDMMVANTRGGSGHSANSRLRQLVAFKKAAHQKKSYFGTC